ncbi:hypothetical protein BJ508DRAFT_308018 [Ascobolus immersus RN42]|uniref:Uncharacterized protein n=1 Tax=Ascobolus immersus RN42 TaxID=1160509 RepID=A0A3N4I135_ASCIM|nr:hypothetical protein BJ508DRAFT_308018 [Ascobolus immersus RN42]
MHSSPPIPPSDSFVVSQPIIVRKQRSLVSLSSSSYSTNTPTPTSSSYCGHSRYDSIVMGASVSVQLERFDDSVSLAKRKRKKLAKLRVGRNPRTSSRTRGSAQAWPPIPFPPQPSSSAPRPPSLRSRRSSTLVEQQEELSRRLSLLDLTVSPIIGAAEEGLWGTTIREDRIPEEEEYEPTSSFKRSAHTEPSSPKLGARSLARSIIGSVHSSVHSRVHSRSHSRTHSFTNNSLPPPLPPTPTTRHSYGGAARRRSQLFAAPPATATRPQHIDLPPTTFDTIPQSLAHLDLADDRPTTPASYTVLGVFKRGSLRITNGAASPVPSTTTGGRTPMCLTPIPFDRPASRHLSSALANQIDAADHSQSKPIDRPMTPDDAARPELDREDSYFTAVGTLKRRNSTSTINQSRSSTPFSFIEDANDERFMMSKTSAVDDGLFDYDDEAHGPPRPEKEKNNEEWLNSEEYKLLRQQWRETLNQRAVTSRYHAAIIANRIPKQPSPHEELPPVIKISPPPSPPRKERFPDDPRYDEEARKDMKSALLERLVDPVTNTRSKSALLSLRPKSSSNASTNTEKSERLFAIQKVQKHKRVPIDSATIDYHNVLLAQTTSAKPSGLSKQGSGDSGYYSAERRAARRRRSFTLSGTARSPNAKINPENRKSTPASMKFWRDAERMPMPAATVTVAEKPTEQPTKVRASLSLRKKKSITASTPSKAERSSVTPSGRASSRFSGLRLNMSAFRGGSYRKEAVLEKKKGMTVTTTETGQVDDEPIRVLGGYDREAVARWTDSIKHASLDFQPEPKNAPPPPAHLSRTSYYEPESPVSPVSPISPVRDFFDSASASSAASISPTSRECLPLSIASKPSPYNFPPEPAYPPPPVPVGLSERPQDRYRRSLHADMIGRAL